MADSIGISFPFRPGPSGFPVKATDLELVESKVKQVVLTEITERLMRPLLGCPLQSYVEENIDSITLEAVKAVVESAILRNIEDISLIDINVTADEEALTSREPTKVTISIQYDRSGRRYQLQMSV